MGKPIQDKTGLRGYDDITMKMGGHDGAFGGDQQSATAASDPGGSMIAPVLNDLGLKLDSEKGQVETLVIDHIERPTEN